MRVFFAFYYGEDAVCTIKVGFFIGKELGGAHEVGGFLGDDAGVFAVRGERDGFEDLLCGLKFGRF
jgi:hypothetical protein